MFCFQCQETAKNTGCTVKGVCGKPEETAAAAMALLDEADTTTYGNPEITEMNIGVGKNPGILISGHDLKDPFIFLKQRYIIKNGKIMPL